MRETWVALLRTGTMGTPTPHHRPGSGTYFNSDAGLGIKEGLVRGFQPAAVRGTQQGAQS